eukprot:gene23690-9229_t
MTPHGNRVDVIEGTLTQLAATMTGQSVARSATRPNAHVSSLKSATTQVRSETLYDIVYIGGKDSVHALSSMTTAFELLAPGGVMIVQNYAHNREHDSVCPRRGIDAFVDVYVPSHAKVLSATFHFFLEKKKPTKATLSGGDDDKNEEQSVQWRKKPLFKQGHVGTLGAAYKFNPSYVYTNTPFDATASHLRHLAHRTSMATLYKMKVWGIPYWSSRDRTLDVGDRVRFLVGIFGHTGEVCPVGGSIDEKINYFNSLKGNV